jgi:hypothetical protein
MSLTLSLRRNKRVELSSLIRVGGEFSYLESRMIPSTVRDARRAIIYFQQSERFFTRPDRAARVVYSRSVKSWHFNLKN